MTAVKHLAGASAEARATKIDRQQYLEAWALDHPLSTIEQAREAVRLKFGISLGTKALADALRNAKALWEAQRQSMAAQQLEGVAGLQAQIATWAEGMRKVGVRLIELKPDGGIRLEMATPTLPSSSKPG